MGRTNHGIDYLYLLVWYDITDENMVIPPFDGSIVLKASRDPVVTSLPPPSATTPVVNAPAPRAAPKAAPVAAAPKKSPKATPPKQSPRQSPKQSPKQSPRQAKPNIDIFNEGIEAATTKVQKERTLSQDIMDYEPTGQGDVNVDVDLNELDFDSTPTSKPVQRKPMGKGDLNSLDFF